MPKTTPTPDDALAAATGTNGRDPKNGRFVPGHRPKMTADAAHVSILKRAVIRAAKSEQLVQIWEAQAEKAIREGDTKAAEFCYKWAVGGALDAATAATVARHFEEVRDRIGILISDPVIAARMDEMAADRARVVEATDVDDD